MSDLLEFLEAWYKWATVDGAPQGEPFLRECGLCDNLEQYGYTGICSDMWNEGVARDDLRRKFHEGGLGTEFPFGESRYQTRYNSDTQHEDPERLAWVGKTIQELKEL